MPYTRFSGPTYCNKSELSGMFAHMHKNNYDLFNDSIWLIEILANLSQREIFSYVHAVRNYINILKPIDSMNTIFCTAH